MRNDRNKIHYEINASSSYSASYNQGQGDTGLEGKPIRRWKKVPLRSSKLKKGNKNVTLRMIPRMKTTKNLYIIIIIMRFARQKKKNLD